MSTDSQQLERVNAWIISMVPEIVAGDPITLQWNNGEVEERTPMRPIRLADVLRALGMAGVHTKYGDWELKGTVDGYGCFYSEDGKPLGNWDLAHDDLSQQSESVISFLLPFCDGHE